MTADVSALGRHARELGLPVAHIPAGRGGTLIDMPTTIRMTRSLASSDAAVMTETMFGVTASTCVLLHGNGTQEQAVLKVLQRGGHVAFALSEPEAGSDLLANLVTAESCGDTRWAFTGRKWLVSHGREAELVYLVARTGRPGPGGFSAFLLEAPLLREAWGTERRASALGQHPMDDLVLDGVLATGQALVGKRGQAMEAILKAMQVVRILSTAASLGCADSALSFTLSTLATRSRCPVAELMSRPDAAHQFGAAATGAILVDVVSTVSARALHLAPGQFSLGSAIAKKAATEWAPLVVRNCMDALGSRGVLDEGQHLRKLAADLEVVRHIDTSPAALDRLIAGHLGMSAKLLTSAEADPEVARLLFRIGEPLPEYDPHALDIFARRDLVLQTSDALVRDVRAHLSALDSDEAGRLEECVVAVAHERDALVAAIGKARATLDQLACADRLFRLYAAISCLGVWWFNRDAPLFGHPEGSMIWPAAALCVAAGRQSWSAPIMSQMAIPAGKLISVGGRLSLVSGPHVAPEAGPDADRTGASDGEETTHE